MSSISSTTSSTSSLRGYSGLASGLDRDSLIESLTYGTTAKIEAQKQKKTSLEWKQSAIQSISDMMIEFANKYTATLTSSTNLFSSVFWGRNSITASGINSQYVSVSGTASSAEAITIAGVKQLAQKAKWTSGSMVSDGQLEFGDLDTSDKTVYNAAGKTIQFEYASQSYSVTLKESEDYDLSTAEGIAAAINAALAASDEQVDVGGGQTTGLSGLLKATADTDGNIVFSRGDSAGGNDLVLTGGTAMSLLGLDEAEYSLNDGGTATGKVDVASLTSNITFAESIGGKTLTFSYNGETASVTLPGADELAAAGQDTDAILNTLKSAIQEQLNDAYGEGRINVDITNGRLVLQTLNPADGSADNSSVLTITGGDSAALSALGVKTGESNRLNLDAKISESGAGVTFQEGETKTITINGQEFTITADDTINSIINRINSNSAAKVTVSYQSSADKFTFTSTAEGASGKIELSGDGDILKELFGVDTTAGGVSVRGQDAIVAVKYGDSDEVVELIRDSNSFTVDGLTIGVKGEFGYTTVDGNKELDATAEAVTFTANVNVDSIVDAIKSMVEEYNDIVDKVNSELTTKPDRDYAPLTSQQKEEMTEDEIDLWETEAKKGLLFGDSDLRNLSSDLRFVVFSGNSSRLSQIGITTSSTYSDNGKIVLDEAKLRAALESDPESVQELFTSDNGIATNLKEVMDKYVKTTGATKGVLIEKAGSSSSPLSLTTNAIYKQLQDIDDIIEQLNTRLAAEQDRYISQFTSLETLISEMNSQSSFLSSFFSY